MAGPKASQQVVLLANKTATTTTTYDLSGLWASLPFVGGPLLAQIVLDETAGTTTCDVTVTGSLDGTNYSTLLAFTQASADGAEIKQFTINPVGCVKLRMVVTLGGSGTWNAKLYVGGSMIGPQGMSY